MTTTQTPAGLETGWLPDTPVDDTILRRFLHTFAASWESVAQAGGMSVRRDEQCSIVDLARPSGLFNSATLLQPLLGAELEDVLHRIEDHYDSEGRGDALLWSAWPTPDLRPRGWTLEGHPPLLVRPPGPAPGAAADHSALSGVVTATALADWSTVTVEAFPLDDVARGAELLPTGIVEDDRWRFVMSREGHRAVATGSQFVEHGLNLLVLAATRPEARGRDHYAALVADRINHRPELPAAAIVSDDSRPVLVGRFGFLPVSRFTLWTRPRP